MKKFMCMMITLLSLNSYAGDKVDKSLAAEADGYVRIHNTRGEISVAGWEKNEVSVKGTLDDLAEEFVFENKGSKTIIKVKLPRNTNFRSRDGSKLKIMVPQGSKVSFSGVATDLRINNIGKGAEVNSVSGDVTLKDIKGRTYINNVSGNLELKDLEGSLEVSTVSGDLDATVDCKKLTIGGVSASLKIKTSSINSAEVSTVSGDAYIVGQMNQDGEIKMSSVSGDAFYYVRGELDSSVSIETAPGGRIINDYSAHEVKKSFINSQTLRFTAGNGSGNIRMSTVSGNVGLKSESSK